MQRRRNGIRNKECKNFLRETTRGLAVRYLQIILVNTVQGRYSISWRRTQGTLVKAEVDVFLVREWMDNSDRGNVVSIAKQINLWRGMESSKAVYKLTIIEIKEARKQIYLPSIKIIDIICSFLIFGILRRYCDVDIRRRNASKLKSCELKSRSDLNGR